MTTSMDLVILLLAVGLYLVNADPFDAPNNGSILAGNTTMEDNTVAYYLYASNTTPTLSATYINDSMANRSLDIINYSGIQLTFCMLYTSIFVLGVFGNVLVCYVVINNKAMQTVTNLFITNLALSDILLCVLAVPFTPLYTFLGGWVFGTPMCHLVPYAQCCSVYISSLTLTSIAIDRFFVIIYPFHPRMKLSTCISIIVTIWMFSLLVTLPYGMYVQMVHHSDTVVLCEEYWPTEHLRKVYSLITTSLQFLLPFVIIAFCYICVSVRLNNRAKTKPGCKTSKRDEADRERKKRTNRMLICMVAIFGVSWLPLNLVNMANDFYSDSNEWRFYNLFFFVAHLTAMSSTCYNPFLYAWLNENFRKEFKQVLPCFDPSHGRNGSTTTSRTWRSGRTCNGNGNETIQETLLPSSMVPEIQPRGAIKEMGMRADSHSPQQLVDTILLNDIKTPVMTHEETVVLPSGVIETKFDNICLPPPLVTAISEVNGAGGRLQPPSAMKKPNSVKAVQQKRLTIDERGPSAASLNNNNNCYNINGYAAMSTDDDRNGTTKMIDSAAVMVAQPLPPLPPAASDMISLINTDSMMLKKQH